MDADLLFKKYLDTWPDAWIVWPTKGQAKMRDFFVADPADPHDFAPVANDILDYIKSEGPRDLTASEWVTAYFHCVRGKEMAKKHLHSHEPLLMATVYGTPPLKDLMDGFYKWFIETEVKPCLK